MAICRERWIPTTAGVAPPVLERTIDPRLVVKARWYVFREMFEHVVERDILELRLRDGRQLVLESASDSSALAGLIEELKQSGILFGKPRSIRGFSEVDFVLVVVWAVILFFVALLWNTVGRCVGCR